MHMNGTENSHYNENFKWNVGNFVNVQQQFSSFGFVYINCHRINDSSGNTIVVPRQAMSMTRVFTLLLSTDP